MRIWRMSLRRAKSTIISWAGSFINSIIFTINLQEVNKLFLRVVCIPSFVPNSHHYCDQRAQDILFEFHRGTVNLARSIKSMVSLSNIKDVNLVWKIKSCQKDFISSKLLTAPHTSCIECLKTQEWLYKSKSIIELSHEKICLRKSVASAQSMHSLISTFVVRCLNRKVPVRFFNNLIKLSYSCLPNTYVKSQ